MKDQLHQTDHRLNADINRWGCLFRSLLAMAELEAGRVLSAVQIEEIYRDGLKVKALGTREGRPGFYVERPDWVIGAGWTALKCAGPSPKQIGVRAMHMTAKPQEWGRTEGARWVILKGATPLGNSHFRLGRPSGVEVFEPRPQTPIAFEERVDYYG